MIARWGTPGLGAFGFGLTVVAHGSFVAMVAFLCASTIACGGYGIAIDRLTGERSSDAQTVVSGLATVLVMGTALAQLGWFGEHVLAGMVALGIALTAVPRTRQDVSLDRFTLIVGGITVALVVVLALLAPDPPILDGINHLFLIARLYDSGDLDLWNSLGANIVGEAVFAWGGGSDAGGLFERGVCTALTVWLVARELAAPSPLARLLFVVVAIVVVLDETPIVRGSTTLLLLAAITALRNARAGTICWRALVLAIALGATRHELGFLAVPLVLAAISRSRWLALGALWLAATFAIQALLGLPLAFALAKSAMMTAAIPLAWLLVHLLGLERERADVAAVFAGSAFLLALVTYAIHPARHVAAATGGAWLGIAFAFVIACDGVERGGIRLGALSLVISVLVTEALVLPGHDPRASQRRMCAFLEPVLAIRDRLELDGDAAHHDVAVLQASTPVGAAIAFWGRSAGGLDFDRNPIADVSTRRAQFLSPIAMDSLRGAGYLLCEDLPSTTMERRTVTYRRALADVESRLVLVGSRGIARLFRVN